MCVILSGFCISNHMLASSLHQTWREKNVFTVIIAIANFLYVGIVVSIVKFDYGNVTYIAILYILTFPPPPPPPPPSHCLLCLERASISIGFVYIYQHNPKCYSFISIIMCSVRYNLFSRYTLIILYWNRNLYQNLGMSKHLARKSVLN